MRLGILLVKVDVDVKGGLSAADGLLGGLSHGEAVEAAAAVPVHVGRVHHKVGDQHGAGGNGPELDLALEVVVEGG